MCYLVPIPVESPDSGVYCLLVVSFPPRADSPPPAGCPSTSCSSSKWYYSVTTPLIETSHLGRYYRREVGRMTQSRLGLEILRDVGRIHPGCRGWIGSKLKNKNIFRCYFVRSGALEDLEHIFLIKNRRKSRSDLDFLDLEANQLGGRSCSHYSNLFGSF